LFTVAINAGERPGFGLFGNGGSPDVRRHRMVIISDDRIFDVTTRGRE